MIRPRSFLFLQGPTSPFFRELGAALAARGHGVRRINLCLGDKLFWNDARSEDFRGRAEDWPAFLESRLLGVTDLVLLAEQRPLHKAAIALAQARGIAVTVTDFGYLRPDWIVWERDGMNALSHFPRDRAGILALAAGAPPVAEARRFPTSFRRLAMWDMAFHLAAGLPWPFPHYRSWLLHPPILGYLGTGWRLLRKASRGRAAARVVAALPAGAPFFVFAMQMETDFSIRAYSPYPDMDTPMREAVESFARHAPPAASLLVKVHPLDPGLKAWTPRLRAMARAAGVEGRVHLLDGCDLDPLLERCAGLVTVNSTAGVRALQLGRPVLALGEAIYRAPGLTHAAGLHSFWTAPEAPDPVLAEAFLRGIAHHLHVRGDYYHPEGRAAAVAATVERLERGAGPPQRVVPPRPRALPEDFALDTEEGEALRPLKGEGAAAGPARLARDPG